MKMFFPRKSVNCKFIAIEKKKQSPFVLEVHEKGPLLWPTIRDYFRSCPKNELAGLRELVNLLSPFRKIHCRASLFFGAKLHVFSTIFEALISTSTLGSSIPYNLDPWPFSNSINCTDKAHIMLELTTLENGDTLDSKRGAAPLELEMIMIKPFIQKNFVLSSLDTPF